MKESPILFNTPMVQAILDGRKTQTRRIIKPQPEKQDGWWFHPGNRPKRKTCTGLIYSNVPPNKDWNRLCRYQPGDRLWVKETFAQKVTSDIQTNPVTLYKANYPGSEKEVTEYMKKFGHKWKPSIHMPKSAARIWLEVINVTIERLQDISKKDAQAEGMRPKFSMELDPYKSSFKHTWEAIHGSESWQQNPWLWVITFKVISTTRNPTASPQHSNTINP